MVPGLKESDMTEPACHMSLRALRGQTSVGPADSPGFSVADGTYMLGSYLVWKQRNITCDHKPEVELDSMGKTTLTRKRRARVYYTEHECLARLQQCW